MNLAMHLPQTRYIKIDTDACETDLGSSNKHPCDLSHTVRGPAIMWQIDTIFYDA